MNLLKVHKYKFRERNNKKLLKIYFNSKSELKNKRPLYCFSGGGIIIINNEYTPIIQRSNSAKTNKNKLSTGSGKPGSIKEIFNPSLLIRELFEEVSFIEKNKFVSFKNSKNKKFLNNKIEEKILKYLKKHYDINKEKKNKLITKSKFFNSDQLIIYLPNNKIKKIKCIIHIDNKMEVNILFAMCLKINKNNLYLSDSEFHDKKKLIKPRNIYLMKRKNKEFLYDRYFNKSVNFNLQSITSHLKYALEKINFL